MLRPLLMFFHRIRFLVLAHHHFFSQIKAQFNLELQKRTCVIFGKKISFTRYAYSVGNGLADGRNEQLGLFNRTSLQQRIFRLMKLIFIKLHITPIALQGYLISGSNCFQRKTPPLKKLHLEVTPDQHQINAIRFCKYLPTQSHNTTADQNTVVQPLLTKHLIFPTSIMENSKASYFFWSKFFHQKRIFSNQNYIEELENHIH